MSLDEIRSIREALSAHKAEIATRLDNGREVMAELRDSIPSTKTVVRWAFGILASVAVSAFVIGTKVAAMPTAEYVQEVVRQHDKFGHESMRDDLRNLYLKQAEQATAMGALATEQTEQGKKLDTIITRLPKRGNR